MAFGIMMAAAAVTPLMAAAPAPAGEGDDPSIVVVANHRPGPIDGIGQSVTIFDEATIERRQVRTLADLLRQAPGVTIIRNGGVGALATVSIRGAESDQTVALIDGIKINDPSSPGGGFDFGQLLLGTVERVEVLRGAQSVLWGSQAIGGVVNLVTRAPGATPAANVRIEGGARQTAQIVGNVSATAGPIAASVGGGAFTTDGVSAFAGGRERDGFRSHAANATVLATVSDAFQLETRGFYSNGRSGIDGYPPPDYAFADTDEISRVTQWTAYGGARLALLGGRFRNRLGYARTDVTRRSTDPEIDLETLYARGRNDRIEYQGIVEASRLVGATFGAEREVSRSRLSSYGGPVASGRARLASLYAQGVLRPLPGLTATAGARHDDHDRFGGATTASGDIAWSFGEGGTVMRASYSEGFKAPSLFQLGSEYGNALLTPERSRGWDAGVTRRFAGGMVELGATLFERQSRDLIAFIGCPTPGAGICRDRPFGTYDNIARASARGIEATAGLRPVDGMNIALAYTWLDARNRTPGSATEGRRLPRRPEHSATLNLDYGFARRLSAGATVTAASDSFDDPANLRRNAGYVLADLRLSAALAAGWTAFARIENVFDRRYQTSAGYGQPGRGGFAGLRYAY